MNKTGIIAFCGSKGSGKNTAATLLKASFPGPVQEIAFADTIKTASKVAFGLTDAQIFDPVLKETEFENYVVYTRENLKTLFDGFLLKEGEDYNVQQHLVPHVGKVMRSPREILQYVGTEIMRNVDLNIHVNVTLKKKDPNALTLITDMRFPNEFENLQATGADNFLPVYVKNLDAEARASTDAHLSERLFEKFKNSCLLVENNGTMQEFAAKIDSLVKEYLS